MPKKDILRRAKSHLLSLFLCAKRPGPKAQSTICQRVRKVKALGSVILQNIHSIPKARPWFVRQISANDDWPFQTLRTVIGEHMNRIRIFIGSFFIQLFGFKFITPEQKAGGRCRSMICGATLFVFRGQSSQRFEIGAALAGPALRRSPTCYGCEKHPRR